MKLEANENIPENRLMFEHNVYVAIEMGLNSRLHLSERIKNHGLDKVRKLPNGRVDLHTINEGARTIVNMLTRREFMKSNDKK